MVVISSDTPRGRHRLVEPTQRPALLPRSTTVVAAAVGVVLTLGAQDEAQLPAPAAPPVDVPVSALQPVVPEPHDGRADPVPAALTGRAIAGAHATGFATARVGEIRSAPETTTVPEALFAA